MRARFLITLAAAGLAMATAACNTVKGVGDDLKSASQSTQDAIHGR